MLAVPEWSDCGAWTGDLFPERLVLRGQFVDHVGVGVDESFEAGAVLLERVVVALQLGEWVVVVPEFGGGAAGVAGELLEVVAEVGVFLGDDPVLDVGFDRELDGGQVAGGALWCAGEESVGGVEDGDPLWIGFVGGPGCGCDLHVVTAFGCGCG